MNRLKLPRLLTDGAVFQKDKPVRIWGWDEAGRTVRCELADRDNENSIAASSEAAVDKDGRFSMTLPAFEAGRAFVLYVRDDAGEEIKVDDIIIGAVWYASGQSNMDLNFDRLRDNCADYIRNSSNDLIRSFDITSESEYAGPCEDLRTGRWLKASPENLKVFSGTATFFAKRLHEKTGIPVGIVHGSLGGSHIYSWMSKEMLGGYPELLSDAAKYGDPAFRAERIRHNGEMVSGWIKEVEDNDEGRKSHWENGIPKGGRKSIDLPVFFSETELDGFIGALWFEKKFTADASFADKDASLWLGTITDSDEAYINGTFVGTTGYRYPPRKYTIPAGTLKEGENTIVLRIRVDIGQGRVTTGKRMMIFNDSCKADPWSNDIPDGAIDLSGKWEYSVGTRTERPAPEPDPIDWRATGLYNAMTAPVTPFPIEGIIWYQGESDHLEPDMYFEMSKLQIEGYRKLWNDDLPFIFAQLPNFSVDCMVPGSDGYGGWYDFREMQSRIPSAVPNTYMAVTMDSGEDNDLHPMNKEAVGSRLADIALDKLYPGKLDIPAMSPEVKSVSLKCDGSLYEAEIGFENTGDMLVAFSKDASKKGAIRDFRFLAGDEEVTADVKITSPSSIVVSAHCKVKPSALYYLHGNTYTGEIIYNSKESDGAYVPCKMLGPFTYRF